MSSSVLKPLPHETMKSTVNTNKSLFETTYEGVLKLSESQVFSQVSLAKAMNMARILAGPKVAFHAATVIQQGSGMKHLRLVSSACYQPDSRSRTSQTQGHRQRKRSHACGPLVPVAVSRC